MQILVLNKLSRAQIIILPISSGPISSIFLNTSELFNLKFPVGSQLHIFTFGISLSFVKISYGVFLAQGFPFVQVY